MCILCSSALTDCHAVAAVFGTFIIVWLGWPHSDFLALAAYAGLVQSKPSLLLSRGLLLRHFKRATGDSVHGVLLDAG